jgi:hypothetical protein
MAYLLNPLEQHLLYVLSVVVFGRAMRPVSDGAKDAEVQ